MDRSTFEVMQVSTYLLLQIHKVTHVMGSSTVRRRLLRRAAAGFH